MMGKAGDGEWIRAEAKEHMNVSIKQQVILNKVEEIRRQVAQKAKVICRYCNSELSGRRCENCGAPR